MAGFSTLYLLHYNNYANGIVKKEETVEDYQDYQIGNPITGVNFIPNDFVSTTQIINWNYDNPDYLIVEEVDTGNFTRWYVMSATRTRAGQLQLELLRDVMADFREQVLASTAYIERGTVPADNPLIFNSEGIKYNQIKKREDLLYDRTGRAWIVGYVPTNVTELAGANINFQGDDAPLINYEEILQYSKKSLLVINSTPTIETGVARRINITGTSSNWKAEEGTITITPDNEAILSGVTTVTGREAGKRAYSTDADTSLGTIANSVTKVFAGTTAYLKSVIANSNLEANVVAENTYAAYNGRIVKSTDGAYYKIVVSSSGNKKRTDVPRSFASSSSNSYWESINELFTQVPNLSSNTDYANQTKISYDVAEYKLSLHQVEYGDISVSFGTGRVILQDAPYYMFCMAYTPENLQLAIQLNTENQNKILDLQVLPYCPVWTYFTTTGDLIIEGLTEHKHYEKIKKKGNPSTKDDYLFWCTKSTDTFDIDYVIEVGNVKIESECDMYRLCSPNGNGQFEFNAAKNGGVLTINVDYTYRPYDPYIHLNPNFGGLYGEDFNDFRGLILNGDFSIPAINDAWTQYTIQNKNYQNIFNREIQTLDLQNKWGLVQDITSAIVGTATGGLAGAMGGNILGGKATGALGGIGAGLSAIGGIIDVVGNQQLRADQKDLKKQLFSYNLQNIQAIPQSVSKTGCITNNNKLVPYVEYYTCTEEEKDALRQMLKYQGMTLGVTGTVSKYVSIGSGEDNAQPIQANIIQMDIDEDFHISMEIANTLKGGVRFA